jgi:hypothetical protein
MCSSASETARGYIDDAGPDVWGPESEDLGEVVSVGMVWLLEGDDGAGISVPTSRHWFHQHDSSLLISSFSSPTSP